MASKRKKKILFVFGTRPEAIKMAPLLRRFRVQKGEFAVRICVTAQHRQMLDDVLALFAVTPDHDLNIMQEGQSLFHVTSAALCRMQGVLERETPDLVLVHGDTTTTFAATLASFYAGVPVGHVEAGLRSYDKRHPFPEEANRLLTDALCSLYFAPTRTARRALRRENVPPEKIFVTGNTVIDALHLVLARKKNPGPLVAKVFSSLGAGARLVLVTAHRRENFGAPLRDVFGALRRIALRHPGVHVAYPVHLNPNVQTPARDILGGLPNVHLLPPLDYADLAHVMKRACCVVTDSGGLQEEAPSLGKPVLVLRRVTERPEAVAAGTVKIVGTDGEMVFSEIDSLLSNPRRYRKMAQAVNPYGDGRASERTVEAVRYFFGLRSTRPKEFGDG